jgi:hypothetical protein
MIIAAAQRGTICAALHRGHQHLLPFVHQRVLPGYSRALHNKMAHMTGPQIASSIVSCSLLSYRNPWLLEQAAKMLVSRKLHKARQLSGRQLADVITACRNLQETPNARLLGHLGTVAAENPSQLASWSAGGLAAVLQAYAAVGFQQPVLLQAAAVRLLQLTSGDAPKQQQQQQQQQQQDLPQLIAAAYYLASMPLAGGTAAERALAGHAVASVAAAALEQQQQEVCCSATDWAKLSVAQLLMAQQQRRFRTSAQMMQQPHVAEPDQLAAVDAAAADLRVELQSEANAQDIQLQQQQVLQQVRTYVLAASSSSSSSSSNSSSSSSSYEGLQELGPDLLCLMQLLWLMEQQQQQTWKEGAAPATQQQPSSSGSSSSSQQQQRWHLGLPHSLADGYIHSQIIQQQQQQRDDSGLLLQAFQAAARKQLPGAEVVGSYQIPGSPLILPAAVLPAVVGAARVPGSKQRGRKRADTAAGASALEDVQQQQQQQHVGLVTAACGTLQQLRKDQLQFEPEVLRQLRDWQMRGVPIAVFAASEGPARLQQRWSTSSQLQQLLPLAQQWERGLACAGWAVLLLEQRPEKSEAVG